MQAKVIIFLLFALFVAVLAVVNIQPVVVNYVIGQTEIPLIFVVIFSVLIGALLLFFLSSMKQLKLQRKIKALEKENGQIKEQLEEYYRLKKEDGLARVEEQEQAQAQAQAKTDSEEEQSLDSEKEMTEQEEK